MVGGQWAEDRESLVLSPGICHKVAGARGQVVRCKEVLCRQGSFLLQVVNLLWLAPGERLKGKMAWSSDYKPGV